MYMGSLAGGHDAQVRDTARCKPRTRTHALTRALVSVCVVRERDAVTLAGVQSDDRGRVLREFVKEAAAGASWMVEVVGDSQQPQVALSVTAEGLEAVEGDEARAWYFVAPGELLGDWTEAYGGESDGTLSRPVCSLHEVCGADQHACTCAGYSLWPAPAARRASDVRTPNVFLQAP